MQNFFSTSNKPCEIFIGQNAGSKINAAIIKAKKKIQIISPYISADILHSLALAHERGAHVNLITSNNNKDVFQTLTDIITQERVTLSNEKKRRRRYWLLSVFIMLLTLSGYSFGAYSLLKDFASNGENVAVFALSSLSLLLYGKLRHKLSIWRIYNYRYHYKFPCKIIPEKHFFMHAKSYLIDDTLFMGSMNLTHNGFYTNFESCITIKDIDTIQHFSSWFEQQFKNTSDGFSANSIGKFNLNEPLN